MMTLIKSNTDPPPKKKANYRTKVMVVEIWRISPFNTLINWVWIIGQRLAEEVE